MSTVAAAVAGDREAFGALYGEHRDMIRSYIVRRVGNWHLAEDLTQEVFRRALGGVDKFGERGHNFGAWLVTIARNIVADYYKGAAYRMGGAGEPVDLVDADRWTDPEYCATHSAIADALTDAMSRLTADQRLCVVLRYRRDLSLGEIAAAVGKNEHAVKALIARATGTLRRDPVVEALR